MNTSTAPRLQLAHVRRDAQGIANAFEFTVRFIRWAEQQHELSMAGIREHWGVSTATAYRWLAGYRAATGQPNHKDSLG